MSTGFTQEDIDVKNCRRNIRSVLYKKDGLETLGKQELMSGHEVAFFCRRFPRGSNRDRVSFHLVNYDSFDEGQ